jgi:hypothetical protein
VIKDTVESVFPVLYNGGNRAHQRKELPMHQFIQITNTLADALNATAAAMRQEATTEAKQDDAAALAHLTYLAQRPRLSRCLALLDAAMDERGGVIEEAARLQADTDEIEAWQGIFWQLSHLLDAKTGDLMHQRWGATLAPEQVEAQTGGAA